MITEHPTWLVVVTLPGPFGAREVRRVVAQTWELAKAFVERAGGTVYAIGKEVYRQS